MTNFKIDRKRRNSDLIYSSLLMQQEWFPGKMCFPYVDEIPPYRIYSKCCQYTRIRMHIMFYVRMNMKHVNYEHFANVILYISDKLWHGGNEWQNERDRESVREREFNETFSIKVHNCHVFKKGIDPDESMCKL